MSRIKHLRSIDFLKTGSTLLLIVVLALNVHSQATIDSSGDNKYFYYSDRAVLHEFDTTLLNQEEYNFIQRKGIEYRNLGNLGSAAYPLQLKIRQETGFDHGLHNYDLYRLEWDSMKLFQLHYPFVQIKYLLGLKSESIFSASHAQRVTKNFDYGVNFFRLNSEGVYKNQKNLQNNFTLYTRIRSSGRRYEAIAKMLMNDMELQENGGLVEDIFDTSITIINRSILEVNLEEAKSDINELAFGLEQSFSLGFKNEYILDSITVSEWVPTFVFTYDAVFRRDKFIYRDFAQDQDFYDKFGIFTDSLEFRQRHSTVEQTFSLSNTGIRRIGDRQETLPLLFDAALTYRYHNISQRSDEQFNNLSIHGGISSNPNDKSRIIYGTYGSAYISGYNRGDIKLSVRLGYDMQKAGRIETEVNLINKSPNYIQQRLESELFWLNDFKNVRQLEYRFRYTLPRQDFNVGVSYFNIGNYTYYGLDGFPKQTSSDLNGVILRLKKDFKLGNRFHLDNSLVYQVYSLDQDVLSKPKIYSENSLYYLGFLFNRALQASFGVDFRIASKYYMPLYLPVTGTFYSQEKLIIENYPSIDLFANVKIDALRLFFKVNNVSQGLIKEGTYSSKYYPFDERSFRFGLSWMFKN
ncbi:MAG: hypothetical protein HKN92_06435 [Chitinophagales bacterium]|nr:hypothetical protein [Chitinophagales bacterium]